MGIYVDNLIRCVLNNSRSSIWKEAVEEWDIVGWDEDETCCSKCICGKEEIKYLYTIRNRETYRVLEPIGSRCIEKFKRQDLNYQVRINQKLFQLMHAIESNEYIELNSNLFSRKLINYLYQEGAFDNPYNSYDGQYDYEFFIKMFNKKSEPTYRQKKKIDAIILNSIKPYLIEILRLNN